MFFTDPSQLISLMLGGEEEPDAMVVRKSEIEVDLEYFSKEEIDPDPGLGVFQIVDGRFSIPFKFDDDIVSIPFKDVTSEQRRYCVESAFDEDYGIVPSVESISNGTIPLPFRVQHDKDEPTHVLKWIVTGDDYPLSYPYLDIKNDDEIIKKGVEITFDYNK